MDGEPLTVQACRRSGRAKSARLTVTSLPIPARTGEEALVQLAECRADVLLLDLVLPDVPEPAMLVDRIRACTPETAIVLISNLPPFSLEKEAARLRTDGWVPKAAKPAQLRDAVRAAMSAPTS